MSRGERKPALYEVRVWDIQGGVPTPTETIRRRTRAAAEAVAKGRCSLPVPIAVEVVNLETGEVLATLWNDAGRGVTPLALHPRQPVHRLAEPGLDRGGVGR